MGTDDAAADVEAWDKACEAAVDAELAAEDEELDWAWLCDSETDSVDWGVGFMVGHMIGAPGWIPPPDPALTESMNIGSHGDSPHVFYRKSGRIDQPLQ